MKKISLAILLFITTSHIHAQGLKRTFDDCITIKNYKVYKNDTIIINCDSAIMMNGLTFNRYDAAYGRLRNNNRTTVEIFNNYDTLIASQQKRLMEQNQEYGSLKFEYDSLNEKTQKIIEKTQSDLHEIKSILDSTSVSLNQTKGLLNDAQEKIKDEKWQRLKTKFGWSLGGLGVGLSVSALFFLLYH